MLIASIKNSLEELIDLLEQLSDKDYTLQCIALSGSSIGEHTRHIIEMFLCLQYQYDSGIINYDKRERNKIMETNCSFAITQINNIIEHLNKENKNLFLKQQIDGRSIEIDSNYSRELLYNFEHCIHHQALIKVGLLQFNSITINENFGIARSTIEYRKQCAQ
jgi:hypothetical protein